MKGGTNMSKHGKKKPSVTIKGDMRRFILQVMAAIVETIEENWDNDISVDQCSKDVGEILAMYSKKDAKAAIEMIMEDEMDIFHNKGKAFRAYANIAIVHGKKIAKELRSKNKDTIEKIIQRMEDFKVQKKGPKFVHPFGTGFQRMKKEITLRPKFLAEDLKFRLLRSVGIY